MIDKILKVLKDNNIDTYRINDVIKESTEVFFVKKKMDTRRIAETRKVNVVVYRTFEKNGNTYFGDATFGVEPSASALEIDRRVKKAYLAAGFVPNKPYKLAEKVVSENIVMKSDIAEVTPQEATEKMVNALYKYDTDDNTFINSAEFFVVKATTRVINSNGVDVSCTRFKVNGEYVCQCKTPEDVETYASFAYDNLAVNELSEKVKETLQMTRDRAVAVPNKVNGLSDVVLSNDYAIDVLSYYGEKTSAALNFFKYFDCKANESAQGDLSEVTGDKLTIDYIPTAPFSDEGIKMEKLPCMQDGVLKNFSGGLRFSQYFGVPVTGDYEKVAVKCGTMSFEEMKKQKGLYIVNFSDFQMDSVTSYFRGEIRLAYYNDGEKVIPVTGGSVNGSILEAQKSIRLSSDSQETLSMKGPKAILLKNVTIAGCE